MRQLARRDDVRVAVAVDIGNIGVLRRGSLGSLGERRQRPLVGVIGPERESDVPVRDVVVGRVGLVHRHDVHVPVEVEVAAGETVAARDKDAPVDLKAIDDVLTP